MTTFDTYEFFLEDAHDGRNGEYEQWLQMVEENWQPTPLPDPPPTCPDCGKPLETYQITVRGKVVTEGTCRTAGCLLNDVTRSADFWTNADEAERDTYRAMNRKAVSA